jgi:hypothetical protein
MPALPPETEGRPELPNNQDCFLDGAAHSLRKGSVSENRR